jgi:O-antigen ligase
VFIARVFTPGMVRRTLVALLVLAVVAMLLAIADRAERGVALFRWPIGPITVTAALAAVWAALAGTWAAARVLGRRIGRGTILLALAAVLSAYVLHQTERRTPVLGLLAAAFVAGALWILARHRRRAMTAGIVVVFAVGLVGAVGYVGTQLRSSDRETAGPVGLRLEYWRLSGGLVARHLLLGTGPDTFVVEMTNAVAPQRAESPHFFHGNLDLYAHNEWIQAAVELGVPAALVYAAMPLGLLVIGWRRLRGLAVVAQPPPAVKPDPAEGGWATVEAGPPAAEVSAMMLALCAAVAAIVVTECASITLRTPMMPAWYWTLLGLLAALCRGTSTGSAGVSPVDSRARRPGHLTAPWLLLASAGACFAITAIELSRSVAEARGVPGMNGRFAPRLYADKTISARYASAVIAEREALGGRRPADIDLALAQCAELYRIMPALHDIPARYAQTLLLTDRSCSSADTRVGRYGRAEEARSVLADALARVNPYDPATNTLYAQVRADDPIERLRCVQRALRGGALDTQVQNILIELSAQPAVTDWLARELRPARAVAGRQPSELPAADIAAPTVELLRINAFLNERAGKRDEAIADQRLAACCYQSLEKNQNRYRRAHEAEIDAFFTLARLLYEADPANYAAAYDAVVEAERYAVLSLPHDRLAEPHPEYGYVWGEVAPTEFPQRLFPLWRLSALLHLAVGLDQYLDARIFSCLPPDRWTPEELNRQLGALAAQAYADLSRIPPDKRPPHYALLADMARRHGPAPPTTSGSSPPRDSPSEPRP